MTKISFKKVVSDKTILLLCILNILFLLYYLMLAFYSRLHFDDLHFLWRAKEMSMTEFVKYFYSSRSGRFISYGKVYLYSKLIIVSNEHRYLPVLFWGIGVSLCWYVAKSVFKNTSSFLIANLVILFYNLYVLTNIDFAVFNWLCAMDYYLLAPMLLITLYLVNQPNLKFIPWIGLVIVALLLGGGQEAFSPIVLVTLFFNGIYYLNIHHFDIKVIWRDTRIRQIIIIGLIVSVCFVFVLIAPGNYIRIMMDDFKTPTSFFGYFSGYLDALSQFYYQLTFYIPYYFLLALLFLSLGLKTSKTKLVLNVEYKKLLMYTFGAYVIYVLLSIFPSVYLWSGFGIQRNYTPIVFFTMLFICFHAFFIGYFKSTFFNGKLMNFMLNIGLGFLICIMLFNLYSDTISAKRYALTVDNRLELLQKLNHQGVTGIVAVDPISIPYTIGPKYVLYDLIDRKKRPHPVLYYFSDTHIKPNEYNDYYKKYYGFNFDIKLK